MQILYAAEYHQSLKNDLNEHLRGKNEEEVQYPIMKSQKWIISQNVEIVKNFYTHKNSFGYDVCQGRIVQS
ncbi:hypothetical protein P5673_009848 [Acropora cervicornis]|uniref:Uncharacterized protein n=1 Tax=Acropora cervicornis TaxID=6130 RepID=A0AAD9QS26_ACRCE|nr:hypothetical protein P5673_009848 [Acropora cervicornis]